MKKKGYFITFEGGEGAGKSIQTEILASHLHEAGYRVKVTREPGGTRLGEQIRAITHNQENVDLLPLTEAYLMAASRAQHVAEVVYPALETGHIVVSDRYIDSSIAYQGYGRKLGAETIKLLNDPAVNGAIPDLTILLNVDVTVGSRRRTKSLKARDRLDLEQKEFYDRVHAGYLELARKDPQRFVVIDANRPIEQVALDIWQGVMTRVETAKLPR